jgi:prepilin-type N-terminal cleavage/methylation domain-containing protein
MQLKKSQSSGFTLIELLVVMVIVGILGSIAAPGWLGLLNRQKINTVSTELKAVLKDAQTKAQQRSTSYKVTVGSTANGPTATLSSAAGTVTTPTVLGSNTQNIQLAAFVGSTTSATNITFDYRGGVPINSVPFVVKITANSSASTQKCLIVTSLLGSIIEAKGDACNNPSLGL